MAKIYFKYGVMGSSKTANALMTLHNYKRQGVKAVLLKPKLERRDGEKIIRSRIGIEAECEFVEDFITKKPDEIMDLAAIIVDEVQFLSGEQIQALAVAADLYDITVFCYGLRTDFQGHLFEGSKTLMEIADIIEEIPTICWCGKKAQFSCRVENGKAVMDGDLIKFGGDDKYVPLCRKHFFMRQISKEGS